MGVKQILGGFKKVGTEIERSNRIMSERLQFHRKYLAVAESQAF
jgi:hypothetical protein